MCCVLNYLLRLSCQPERLVYIQRFITLIFIEMSRRPAHSGPSDARVYTTERKLSTFHQFEQKKLKVATTSFEVGVFLVNLIISYLLKAEFSLCLLSFPGAINSPFESRKRKQNLLEKEKKLFRNVARDISICYCCLPHDCCNPLQRFYSFL